MPVTTHEQPIQQGGRVLDHPALKLLFSNKLTLVLLLAFAVSMAYATFVENDFGTPAARALIYDAWWFEVLMIGLGLNFIGNIFRYRLFRREKWPILIFHIAFVTILLGALVTRYTSLEGLVRIREGQRSNTLISQQHYLQATLQYEGPVKYFEKPLNVSVLTPPQFEENIGTHERPLWLRSVSYIPTAEEVIVPGKEGSGVLEVATANENGREDQLLRRGKSLTRDSLVLSFDHWKNGAINIVPGNGKYFLHSPRPLQYMTMATQQVGSVVADTLVELKTRTLYQAGTVSFVISAIHEGKVVDYRTTKDKEAAKMLPNVLKVALQSKDQLDTVVLKAFEGLLGSPQMVDHNGTLVRLSYGPKPIPLPFSLHLNDFQLERYPGSTSPSSYASELTVIDGEQMLPYRIFMNNVLDYGGYRFFQASYDLDEKGTVLSVNRDWWGTRITYLGYFMMGAGMLLALFGKGSRFHQLNRQLEQLRARQVSTSLILVFALITPAKSNVTPSAVEHGKELAASPATELAHLIAGQYVDPAHAAAFGQLLVQDLDGRIKPINTLASEFLRKVMRKVTFKFNEGGSAIKMDCNQVFLSIHTDPAAWQYIPLVKVDVEKGGAIFARLEKTPSPYLAFQDFLDEAGNYKLGAWVDEANRKKPAERTSFDQEILKVDERFNIVYQALTGSYLKIFPQPRDPDNTWFSYQFHQAGFTQEDSLFERSIIPKYFHSIQQARLRNDWHQADENLAYIQTFQAVLGKAVSPSSRQVRTELLYNRLNLFTWLFPFFWGVGLLLLIMALLQVFTGPKKWLKIVQKTGVVLATIGFTLLTANLLLRWYAGGHPPWSNGYEMTIFVAWSLLFFSYLFLGKSNFILPLASLFCGTLLFVAFLDWLNPEITNLVPVLKSYWLKIHVAVIVSSYAPLALSALLGFTALWLMISKAFNNSDRVNVSIQELTYLNEMSMTVGVFLLAIGTFLGGVWANESWGRYWGWDPKETWALISIILYAAVLHFRLVPRLRSIYTFNLASVWAFSSIIMTSFGVNYYLAGLHSYAKGDPVPIPAFVYWVVAIITLTAIAAYFVEKKMKQKIVSA